MPSDSNGNSSSRLVELPYLVADGLLWPLHAIMCGLFYIPLNYEQLLDRAEKNSEELKTGIEIYAGHFISSAEVFIEFCEDFSHHGVNQPVIMRTPYETYHSLSRNRDNIIRLAEEKLAELEKELEMHNYRMQQAQDNKVTLWRHPS